MMVKYRGRLVPKLECRDPGWQRQEQENLACIRAGRGRKNEGLKFMVRQCRLPENSWVNEGENRLRKHNGQSEKLEHSAA